MGTAFLYTALLLTFPALTLYGEKRYKFFQWIGAMVICYITGMLIGNLPFIQVNHSLFSTISEISVSLAIPALLFSANLSLATKYTKAAMLSFSICAIAVSISASGARVFLARHIHEAWKISGMLVGVYTGGTPNMSAIGKALGVKDEAFILVNSADMVVSGLYFIFLTTIGPQVLKKFLPSKPKPVDEEDPAIAENSFNLLPFSSKLKNIGISLLLSVIALALASAISIAILDVLSAPVVILVLTTLGLGGSFVPRIQKLEGAYQTAHYLLLIFALSIGMLADFNQLLTSGSNIFGYCAVVMVSSVLLHYLMAALLKIEADIVLITSTAAIFGPAFIGPVANKIGDRQIIVVGITTGMLGYAIGNYLGLGLAWVLQ